MRKVIDKNINESSLICKLGTFPSGPLGVGNSRVIVVILARSQETRADHRSVIYLIGTNLAFPKYWQSIYIRWQLEELSTTEKQFCDGKKQQMEPFIHKEKVALSFFSNDDNYSVHS